MSFNADFIRHLVVRPVLTYLDMHSAAAEELMLGTMAHESLMGTYHRQQGGPAQGFWQVEPATEADNWDNWLSYRPDISRKAKNLISYIPETVEPLVTNPYYNCAMARIKYYRAPAALPAADDIQGLAQYWKDHYNSHLGAGHPDQWVGHYRRFVLGSG